VCIDATGVINRKRMTIMQCDATERFDSRDAIADVFWPSRLACGVGWARGTSPIDVE
jgi:hypothetical protein